MTLIYIGLALNFAMMIGSWVVFFKFMKLVNLSSEINLEEIKEDLDLVIKNPAAARRKLKNR
jgi:hypothetical protein